MPQQNTETKMPQLLMVHANSARELMTHNPLSLRAEATPLEAAQFFIDKRLSAAPVIDERGRPVGVLSLRDLVRQIPAEPGEGPAHRYYQVSDEELSGKVKRAEVELEQDDKHKVRDIMTPAVYAVQPESSAREVLEAMLAHRVHRVFVVEPDGTLIGVISVLDIVRDLCNA